MSYDGPFATLWNRFGLVDESWVSVRIEWPSERKIKKKWEVERDTTWGDDLRNMDDLLVV